jgi:hypothetical protein
MIKNLLKGVFMKLTDRMGERYGRLLVVGRAPNKSDKDTNARWVCACDCGRETTQYGQDLKKGKVVSCGCWNDEKKFKHGMARQPVYKVWQQLHQRCENPKAPKFYNYGGRGIKVCERWKSFENFAADMGIRPEGYSIERINNDGDYEPSNCMWATTKQQLNNRRISRFIELNGERKTIAQWADQLGVKYDLIRCRIDRYGWSIERALTTPVKSLKPS